MDAWFFQALGGRDGLGTVWELICCSHYPSVLQGLALISGDVKGEPFASEQMNVTEPLRIGVGFPDVLQKQRWCSCQSRAGYPALGHLAPRAGGWLGGAGLPLSPRYPEVLSMHC